MKAASPLTEKHGSTELVVSVEGERIHLLEDGVKSRYLVDERVDAVVAAPFLISSTGI